MNKIQVSVIVPFYYGNKYIENIYETIRKNVEVLKNHKYNNILDKLKNLNLIIEQNNNIALTQRGRELSNTVFIEFID